MTHKPARWLLKLLYLSPALMTGCSTHSHTSLNSAFRSGSPHHLAPAMTPSHRRVAVDDYTITSAELSSSLSTSAVIDRIMARQQIKSRTGSRGKGLLALQAKARLSGRSGKRNVHQPLFDEAPVPLDLTLPANLSAGGGGRGRFSTIPLSRPGRLGDNWDGVRGGMLLATVQHEDLEAQVEHFRQNPAIVRYLMGRAEPFLHYLTSEIRRHGLPSDLILVPMVESAFQTDAVSPKQAAGMWQFIPSTGQRFGLTVSEDYDARLDVHPATQAALKYLKYLNGLFRGDWLLTFAAYNAGEGAVQRAIETSRKSGGSGRFWDLDLPAETEAYVIKILSLAKVIAYPGQGSTPMPTVQAGLTHIQAGPTIKVVDLIRVSGITPDEFYRLNPAYKPGVEPPSQVHDFLLPRANSEALLAARLSGVTVLDLPSRTPGFSKGEKKPASRSIPS